MLVTIFRGISKLSRGRLKYLLLYTFMLLSMWSSYSLSHNRRCVGAVEFNGKGCDVTLMMIGVKRGAIAGWSSSTLHGSRPRAIVSWHGPQDIPAQASLAAAATQIFIFRLKCYLQRLSLCLVHSSSCPFFHWELFYFINNSYWIFPFIKSAVTDPILIIIIIYLIQPQASTDPSGVLRIRSSGWSTYHVPVQYVIQEWYNTV